MRLNTKSNDIGNYDLTFTVLQWPNSRAARWAANFALEWPNSSPTALRAFAPFGFVLTRPTARGQRGSSAVMARWMEDAEGLRSVMRWSNQERISG